MKLLLLFLILALFGFFKGAARDRIKCENNGPVTYGTPITFTVKIHHSTDTPSYQLRFKFFDFPNQNINISSTSNVVNYTEMFQSPSVRDSIFIYNHLTDISVWYCPLGVPSHEISYCLFNFLLVDSMDGFIDVTQNISERSLQEGFVSTASPVELTALIYHPTGFYDSANKTYKWTVNGSPQEESYDFIVRNFSKPQLNNISVLVSVSKTNPVFQKTELFTLTLHSKDPIQNLTTDSQNNIQLFKDENLQLNVKINGGTPPFYFCWEITNSTISGRNIEPSSEISFWLRYAEKERKKSSDSDCEKTDESSFSINSHFEEAGNKTLYIDVNNYVSSLTKIMTISVHERESLRQPAANKPKMPVVMQENSSIMKKYKPVIYSEEAEISDKEIESYLRSKNEIEFIKDMLTDFQNSSWRD
ncbi:transmembrane protein 130-like [Tetranychus urticae]|uniref:transmembrane protein 130-like n=1 Tax=Tetranychus urticae TaxID=32264 RepID=UPI00077C09F7|nr:transmembrane protein 130-like [Tetranychus urticae]